MLVFVVCAIFHFQKWDFDCINWRLQQIHLWRKVITRDSYFWHSIWNECAQKDVYPIEMKEREQNINNISQFTCPLFSFVIWHCSLLFAWECCNVYFHSTLDGFRRSINKLSTFLGCIFWRVAQSEIPSECVHCTSKFVLHSEMSSNKKWFGI